jgi:hypothetical protein
MTKEIQIDKKQREILRAELSQMGSELMASNPGASAEDIKIFLKNLIDVSI